MEATSGPVSQTVNSLTLWYEKYMALGGGFISEDSDVVEETESDELDYDEIEAEVHQLVPTAEVVRGFCRKCRWLLSHWPNFATEETVSPDDEGYPWPCVVGRDVRTREIEAATRAGCKFCMFLWSRLIRDSQLDTFRRIERRLSLLGKSETASLSIEEWGRGNSSHLLWLNFPGKTATHCNDDGARACSSYSEMMSPTCEQEASTNSALS